MIGLAGILGLMHLLSSGQRISPRIIVRCDMISRYDESIFPCVRANIHTCL